MFIDESTGLRTVYIFVGAVKLRFVSILVPRDLGTTTVNIGDIHVIACPKLQGLSS